VGMPSSYHAPIASQGIRKNFFCLAIMPCV
jgi:hypothetical protein